MPWKAMTLMSQRQEFVELALAENANIRALCREYRITPRTGYKWIKRFQEQGTVGLIDHSRQPKHSPRKSNPVVEEAVLKVRRAHPAWGGRKIRWQLAREGMDPIPSRARSRPLYLAMRCWMMKKVENTVQPKDLKWHLQINYGRWTSKAILK